MAAGSCQPSGPWGAALARGAATSKRPKMGWSEWRRKKCLGCWIVSPPQHHRLSQLLVGHVGSASCTSWPHHLPGMSMVRGSPVGQVDGFPLPRHFPVGFCWDFMEFAEHFLCGTSLLLSDLVDDSQEAQMLLWTGRQLGRSAVVLFP